MWTEFQRNHLAGCHCTMGNMVSFNLTIAQLLEKTNLSWNGPAERHLNETTSHLICLADGALEQSIPAVLEICLPLGSITSNYDEHAHIKLIAMEPLSCLFSSSLFLFLLFSMLQIHAPCLRLYMFTQQTNLNARTHSNSNSDYYSTQTWHAKSNRTALFRSSQTWLN